MQLNLHLFSDLSLESMSLSKHLLIKKEDGEITFSGSLDLREALKAIELKINEEEAKSMDWILGDLDTFPVQQSELEDILMSKGKSEGGEDIVLQNEHGDGEMSVSNVNI